MLFCPAEINVYIFSRVGSGFILPEKGGGFPRQSGILESFLKFFQIPISGMVELKEISQRYL